MAKETKKDEVSENRISDEILVDAFGEEEHATGWATIWMITCNPPCGQVYCQ